MSSGSTCRECGTAIPADSPGGFCAQCLLGLGLHEVQSPESKVESPRSRVQSPQSNVQTQISEVQSPRSKVQSQEPVAAGSLTEKPGDRIGRYRLLQEIGHGGCGVVYMA